MRLKSRILHGLAAALVGFASTINVGALGDKDSSDPYRYVTKTRPKVEGEMRPVGDVARDSLSPMISLRVMIRNDFGVEAVKFQLKNMELNLTEQDENGDTIWHIIVNKNPMPVSLIKELLKDNRGWESFIRCSVIRNRSGRTPVDLLLADSKKLASFKHLVPLDKRTKLPPVLQTWRS